MNVKEIENTFGLPARVKIPLSLSLDQKNIYVAFRKDTFLYRTITKRLENGNYLQYDETQSHLGEFQCCYWNGTPHNDWEYIGKPGKEQLPYDLGDSNGRNE